MKSFKQHLEENRLAAATAALGIMGSAMAVPPQQEMPQIDRVLQGLASAEHRGRLKGSVFEYNPELYIRTGGADPSKPKSVSTAYGPFQFTKSTIEDLSKRHPKTFAGSEDYVGKFVGQGKKMLSSPSDPTYGYRGKGDLSGPEHHEDYMNMSRAALSAMAKDIKVDLSKPLSADAERKLVKRFRGIDPEPAYTAAYRRGVDIPKPSSKSAPAPSKTTPPSTQTATPTDYEIKPGDTLGAIAKKQGVTVDELMKRNPHIKDPNKIKAGDKLKTK